LNLHLICAHEGGRPHKQQH